ncbi:pickpocket protein 28-like [Contarinia nasturtii]|uniref:pickpocket protein 28-like n=1 Tax=Contarinia nasturtii TaxID=265458 RepID=UPI0012D38B33|nr:pickpocket protein 28-like [Contarinia nasturtii]
MKMRKHLIEFCNNSSIHGVRYIAERNRHWCESTAPQLMTVNTNKNISHWSVEGGYKKGLSDQYPFRLFSADEERASLFISMQLSVDDFNYLCAGVVQGFDISLTMPGEIPRSMTRNFQILPSENVYLLMKPKMYTTSNELRRYSPSERKCFFNSERRLHFFQFYTQNNCEGYENTRICGAAKIECYQNAEMKLFEEGDSNNDNIRIFRDICNCLPACDYFIKYTAEIDRTTFDRSMKALDSLKWLSNLSDIQVSLVSISFVEYQVVTLLRSESYTFMGIIGYCGGLLGLFLGISLLSIVEMIYFATFRWFWSPRRSRNDNVVISFKRPTLRQYATYSDRAVFNYM